MYRQGGAEEDTHSKAPQDAIGRPAQRKRKRIWGMVEDRPHTPRSYPTRPPGSKAMTSWALSQPRPISLCWRCTKITSSITMGPNWM